MVRCGKEDIGQRWERLLACIRVDQGAERDMPVLDGYSFPLYVRSGTSVSVIHTHTSVNLFWKNPPRHSQSRASLMLLGISFEKLCVMCVCCWELNPQTLKALCHLSLAPSVVVSCLPSPILRLDLMCPYLVYQLSHLPSPQTHVDQGDLKLTEIHLPQNTILTYLVLMRLFRYSFPTVERSP